MAKAANWVVCPEFQKKVELIFGGMCQEDILEDSLGKVRDAEYRGGSSRVMRLFKSFEVPVMQKQLAQWGRDEVRIVPELPLGSASGDYSDFFRFRKFQNFNMSAVKASGAQHGWQTFTPATCRVASAELALLKHIVEEKEGQFLLVGEAWKASLVPQGCIIIHRGIGGTQAHFALLPTTAGVLAWPCERVNQSCVGLAGRWGRPFWAPVFRPAGPSAVALA